jgi:predicted Zn-dependent protease
MRVGTFSSAAALLALALSGCGDPHRTMNAWVERQGGLAPPSEQARAAGVFSGLSTGYHAQPISLRVLASTDVEAYCWKNRDIFITRGLLELLNDEELAAAMAHEVGHLLNDGRLQSVVHLRGSSGFRGVGRGDEEERADAAGTELLRSAGQSPDSMVRMLHSVMRAPGLDRLTAASIWHRILALQARRANPGFS